MARPKLLVESEGLRARLTSRGVPRGVLHSPCPTVDMLTSLISSIEINPDAGIKKAVRVSKQEQYFTRSLEEPLSPNYLYCIAGQRSDTIPLQMGLRIFLAAASESDSHDKPYWHTLVGSPKDDLRDGDAGTETRVGSPSLLVLSNIASNSTAMKVEKVRDLLSRYMHIPRIVIVGGCDPLIYCSTVLFMSPNRVTYIGK